VVTIWLTGIMLAILAGVVLVLSYAQRDRTPRLAIVAAIMVAILGSSGFVAYPIAHSTSQATKIGGYKQTLNGSVVAADVVVTKCNKEKEEYGGSNCRHTEPCDSYTEWVTEYYTDGNGKRQSRQVQVTKWYDCPLDSHEYTYTVTAVAYHLYSFTIADHIFGSKSRHLRGNDGGISRSVPVQWQRAKDNLAAGNPDPVTVPDTYENYILGSESEMLQAHSSDIKMLEKKKLLPSVVTPIHDHFLANKVSFVGMDPINEARWQDSLMRFNAAFGTLKQGDMRVVALRASALPPGISPEDYIRALKAHWQSDFGKDAFPKNAVLLVLAVDDSGRNITWARAETGMPIGNHEMLSSLMLRLHDQPFLSETVFGTTTASVTAGGAKPKVTYTAGSGIVPQTVLTDFPFRRACMGCADKDEKGQQGFVDLKDLIPVSGWAVFWTALIMLFIAAVFTVLAMIAYNFTTGNTPKFWNTGYSSRHYGF
jgi:hypothetical protein